MSDLRVESRPDPQRRCVPVRFGPPGGPVEEVETLLDWWPGQGHHYFRVRVGDGAEYILRQDLATGTWRVDFFRSGGNRVP